MTSAAYEADLSVVAQKAAAFDDVGRSTQARMDQLIARLGELQGAWVGTSGTSFQTVKDRYDADMKKLTTSLNAIAAAVEASGGRYTAGDEESSQTMTQAGAQAGSVSAGLMGA